MENDRVENEGMEPGESVSQKLGLICFASVEAEVDTRRLAELLTEPSVAVGFIYDAEAAGKDLSTPAMGWLLAVARDLPRRKLLLELKGPQALRALGSGELGELVGMFGRVKLPVGMRVGQLIALCKKYPEVEWVTPVSGPDTPWARAGTPENHSLLIVEPKKFEQDGGFWVGKRKRVGFAGDLKCANLEEKVNQWLGMMNEGSWVMVGRGAKTAGRLDWKKVSDLVQAWKRLRGEAEMPPAETSQ